MAKRVSPGDEEPERLPLDGGSSPKRRKASPQTITDEQVETFFETLADTCNVVRSAKAAEFSANWAYRKRRRDAAFRRGWAAAVREGYAKLELVLLERAMKGTPKLVRTARGTDRIMREYSTALAVALLRRHSELADSAADGPDQEELNEVRERILEKLRRLKERDDKDIAPGLDDDGIETKAAVGRTASGAALALIQWAVRSGAATGPLHQPSPSATAGPPPRSGEDQ